MARRLAPFLIAGYGLVAGSARAAQPDAPPLFDAGAILDAATRKVEPSVFMLAELGHGETATSRPIGTAFLISRKHRLLATAAHVIDESDGDGEAIVAITAGATATYRVVKSWYHPAITRAFDDGMIVRSLNPRDGPMATYDNDVAIVQLDEGGPDLPPEVRLATASGLDAKAPFALAIFGYPQSLYPKDDTQPLVPVGRGAQGSSLTAAMGDEARPVSEAFDIQMESEPGHSGSPSFRADGSIVGIVHGSDGVKSKHAFVAGVESLRELIAYHHLEPFVDGLPGPAPRRFDPPARLDRKGLRTAISLGARAEAALELGHLGTAKTFLKSALDRTPTFTRGLTVRGEIYLLEYRAIPVDAPTAERLRLLEDARQDLLEAVTLDPRRFDNWLGFIRVGLEQAVQNQDRGDFDYFLITIDRMLGAHYYTDEVDDVDRASALHARSQAHAGLGNLAKAMTDLDEAVRLEPSAAEFFRARAVLRETAGDVDRGLMDRVAADLLGRREGFVRRRWR